MKKPVITPKGTFRTYQEAADAHGCSRQYIHQKVANKRAKEFYLGEPVETASEAERRVEAELKRLDEEYIELVGDNFRIHPELDFFKVSDTGIILKRVDSIVGTYWKEATLTPTPTGYLRVCYKDGQYYVHRLVGQTFFIWGKGPHINHIDLNKQNNDRRNLEWCSFTDNIRHYHDNKDSVRPTSIYS